MAQRTHNHERVCLWGIRIFFFFF